jgi:hypothetical protein
LQIPIDTDLQENGHSELIQVTIILWSMSALNCSINNTPDFVSAVVIYKNFVTKQWCAALSHGILKFSQ